MPKTIWYFAEGEWHQVVPSEGLPTGTGGTVGIQFEIENEGGLLDIIANDVGGISLLATGGGSGWDAGQMLFECNGGTSWFKNADEGVIIYGTGHLTSGRITDLDSSLLETGADRPSLILAGSNGVVISSSAIDAGDEFGALSVVFLFADTGNNLLRSPAIHARTSDPGIPGALWNSSGTVKISL